MWLQQGYPVKVSQFSQTNNIDIKYNFQLLLTP